MADLDPTNPKHFGERYRCSGRIDWVRTLPWLGLLGFAVMLAAIGSFLIFHAGFYAIGLVPIVMSLILSGAIFLLVSRGHWRNRWLAGGVGLIAGSFAYLGYFHIDMIWWGGFQVVSRIDALPEFIALRMETDTTEDAGSIRSPASEDPSGTKVVSNWVYFVMEWAIMALMPAVIAWLRAERAYCEKCRAWMKQSAVGFDIAAANGLAAFLTSGLFNRIEELPQVHMQQRQPAAMLLLAHCDETKPRGDTPCPVYATVKASKNSGTSGLTRYRGTFGAQIRERRVSPEEVARLLPLLPQLKPFADERAAKAAESMHVESNRLRDETRRVELGGERIVVEEFPDETVLTRRNIYLSNALAIKPFALPLVGIGLIALGVLLLIPTYDPSWDLVLWKDCPAVVGGGIVAVGAIGLVYGLIVAMIRMTSARDRFFHRKTREVVERRSRRLVEPGAEGTFFVEVVPRENWGKMKLETATDFGFLAMNRARGAVLFEGDRRRIRIPLKALTRVNVETLTGVDGKPQFYLVVIQAKDGTTELELPATAYEPPWSTAGKAKREMAARLCAAICGGVEALPPGSAPGGALHQSIEM